MRFATEADRCPIANQASRQPAKLCDTADGSLLWPYTGGDRPRNSLTLFPNGKTVTFQLLDRRFEFWDIDGLQKN